MGLQARVRAARRGLRSGWIAATLCSVLLLLAGSRLVVLSLQLHAVRARAAAQQLADSDARALELRLQALAQAARARAALTANAAQHSDGRAALQSLPVSRGRFWMLPDGSVLGVAAADRAAVDEIQRAWGVPSSVAGGSPALRLIGPEPEGSRWFVAARAPLQPPGAERGATVGAAASAPAAGLGSQPSSGWAVAFQALEPLLVDARLNQLTAAGYQFRLTRADPASAQLEAIATSAVTAWSNPVIANIALAGSPAGGWQLSLQPRIGWYPMNLVVVEVSLLILVIWLTALGVRDVSRHMGHLRSALGITRRRLQQAQQQLAQEMEQRQNLQRSVEHAHYHDAFTGLPNRHYFLGQLDRALREMRARSSYRIAVLLIAVDRYKLLTDTLGHTAGDELMMHMTRLFDQILAGREHVLARWADDALVVLLGDVPAAQAAIDIARSIQQGLQSPIALRHHRVLVATSIGTSYVESGLQRAEEVLREADIALSGAKSQGHTTPVLYSASLQTRLMHLTSLEGDLHAALERGEFRLRFQPIVDLRARRIVGLEVLLRWLHPVEGLLTPDRFLRFAEESGLIVPITRWIIQRTCQLRGEWAARLPEDVEFYTSINLSPTALLDPGLSDYVAQVLDRTGTAPAALKFELTENGLISNVGAARAALDRLHAMGIELMLDDFGTGYSSLCHLQLFPFDYIKIDGPVRTATSEDHSGGALVRAMAQMASTLGLKAVAETVESALAVEALQQIGCEFAQGNAFCAPVDAERAVERLRQRILEPTDDPEVLAESQEEEFGDSPTLILPILPEPAHP